MSITEDELYDMSDAELEAAFKAAKAEQASPDTEIEETEFVEEETHDETSEEEQEEIVDLDGQEENDTEHPEDEQDSGHDASEDESEDDEAEEDAEETDEDNPDGDAEEEDTVAAEEEESKEEESQPVEPMRFKANGKEYEFTEEEIKTQFPRIFGQAMDYTKKMQALKPHRKTIDAIEQAQLSHDDINLAIDILKGDKEAIAEVMKRTGVDALDLNADESNYVAKDYGRDEDALAINDILEDISRDPEYAMTERVLGKDWDDTSWGTMSKNPEMIRALHVDIKSGMFDKVQPIAEKRKLFDGGRKSDLEYYMEAAQQHIGAIEGQKAQELEQAQAAEQARLDAVQRERDRVANAKAQDAARAATRQASKKRKDAAPTKSSAGKPSGAVDYLNSSDEDFEDWYKRTME